MSEAQRWPRAAGRGAVTAGRGIARGGAAFRRRDPARHRPGRAVRVHRVTGASGAGQTGLGALVELTAAASVADAFVAVSLAGTTFFSTNMTKPAARWPCPCWSPWPRSRCSPRSSGRPSTASSRGASTCWRARRWPAACRAGECALRLPGNVDVPVLSPGETPAEVIWIPPPGPDGQHGGPGSPPAATGVPRARRAALTAPWRPSRGKPRVTVLPGGGRGRCGPSAASARWWRRRCAATRSWVVGGLLGLLVSMLDNGRAALARAAALLAAGVACLLVLRRRRPATPAADAGEAPPA